MARSGKPRSPASDSILLNHIGHLATMNDKLGEIEDAAVFVKSGVVKWVGKAKDLPSSVKADTAIDMQDRVVIPGFGSMSELTRSQC